MLKERYGLVLFFCTSDLSLLDSFRRVFLSSACNYYVCGCVFFSRVFPILAVIVIVFWGVFSVVFLQSAIIVMFLDVVSFVFSPFGYNCYVCGYLFFRVSPLCFWVSFLSCFPIHLINIMFVGVFAFVFSPFCL